MAISNVSSGGRPGVCTSTTRPEAPFNGQVIYETDTKQTLVWQGSAWVMLTDADQPPGLQLVKSQTVGSGVSSVTVTDAFSADYQNYRIVMSGTSFTVADTNFNIRPDNDSTAAYYGGGFFQQFGISALNPFLLSAGTQAAVGITATIKNAFIFDVTDPFDSTSYTRFLTMPNTGNGYVGHYWGMLATGTSYTDFTLFPSSGTMTGGTIRVYGYRN